MAQRGSIVASKSTVMLCGSEPSLIPACRIQLPFSVKRSGRSAIAPSSAVATLTSAEVAYCCCV
jgi:hypothetical protein